LEGLLEVVWVLRSKKQGVEWVGRPAGSGGCVEEVTTMTSKLPMSPARPIKQNVTDSTAIDCNISTHTWPINIV